MLLIRDIKQKSCIIRRSALQLINSQLISTTHPKCRHTTILDEKNPYNTELSACYKRTFAYYSMNKRLPIIIQQIMDDLVRNRDAITQKYGITANEELKQVISSLSQLKCDIITDNEFQPFNAVSSDRDMWNTSLCEIGNKNTFFSSVWLFAECYIFRRIREIFLEQSALQYYDYFQEKKENSLKSQFAPIKMIANYVEKNRIVLRNQPEKLQKYFEDLIKLDLWGNQLDLSISDGKQTEAPQDPLAAAILYDPSILVNDLEQIWQCVSDTNIDHRTSIVDYVCDNVGYELFIDFCIGDFLLENCLANCIRYHVKMVPFFISDVMPDDFLWTLCRLRTDTDVNISKIGKRCSDYLEDGRFKLMDNEYFWTMGYGYSRMQEIDPTLYMTLSEAKLVIFKGDMNYRKLLNEINWEPSTPFVDALKGFRPSNLCSLRTLKAELISGLKPGLAQKLEQKNSKWLIIGEYGVIHFAEKNN